MSSEVRTYRVCGECRILYWSESCPLCVLAPRPAPGPAEGEAVDADIRAVVEEVWRIAVNAGQIHNKADLACSYDDYGTGASGMGSKPCAVHRAKRERWSWCRECRLKERLDHFAVRTQEMFAARARRAAPAEGEAVDGLESMLAEDNKRMREAGCKLAEAAQRVVRTYDGLHRLSKTIAGWADTIADEGGRAARARRGRP